MPSLTNKKHEIFARNLAMGMSQIEAYVAAGYEHNYGNASTTANKPHIVKRVDELIAERRAGREINPDIVNDPEYLDSEFGINERWVVDQLKNNVQDARDAGQFAASNKALEMLGKVCGLFDAPKGREDTRKTQAESQPLDMNKLAEALAPADDDSTLIDVTPTVSQETCSTKIELEE